MKATTVIAVTVMMMASIAMPARADIVPTDSVAEQHTTESYTFHSNQLWWPVALSVAGGTGAVLLGDHYRQRYQPTSGTRFDDVLRFVPSAAHLGLTFTRVPARHCRADRLLASATAHLTAVALSSALKAVVHEQRPDASNNHAFPSGHTVIAFTGAELLRIEYGTAIGLAGYGVATVTAVCRVAHHRHWLHDVLAGAGIGVACARIGYWLVPFERRLFGLDKRSGHTRASVIAIAPTYDPISGCVQVAFAAHF